MRIRRAGRPIRACGKHTKGKRTSRRVAAAECVDERVSQLGTSIARNNPIAQRRGLQTQTDKRRFGTSAMRGCWFALDLRRSRLQKVHDWTLTVKFPPNLRETSQPVEIGVHVSFSLSFTCH